jgi:sugar/nucleoside kinase (ribokinase family)
MAHESQLVPDHRMDLVLVGHFALDTIINKSTGYKGHSLGGGVTYGGLAASYFDPTAKIGIVSRVGRDFNHKLLKIFNNHQVDLCGIIQEGDKSTGYQLIYHETGRDLKLLSKAPNFSISDIPHHFISAKAIHMTPIANEFTPEFIENLASHQLTQDSLIGIDVQGIIRDFDKDRNVIMRKDSEIRDRVFTMLQQFGRRMFFKASDNEALAVTGMTEITKATEYLAQSGAYIFTTLGAQGLLFKVSDHPMIHLNAYEPSRCVDETGAGDCFMATLLLQLAQLDPKDRTYEAIIEAAKMASAASSFLIEEKGPNGFQSKEIIAARVAKGKLIKY